MISVFQVFFGTEWTPCAPDQRRKGSSRLLPANKSKSQGLSWLWGCVSALAKVTCTSVMAQLMLKSNRDFGAQYAASRRHLFQGRPCIFQQDNAKPHSAQITKSWLGQRKRVRVLDWPACSPDLSPIRECVAHLKRKMRQRRHRNVAHLKTCLQE